MILGSFSRRDTADRAMPSYTLKDIPEPLYERIRESADRSRRSINAEILRRLERSLMSERIDPHAFLASVRARRESGELPWIEDEDLRRARESGRP